MYCSKFNVNLESQMKRCKRNRRQSVSGKWCELLWCFSIYFKLLHIKYQKISGQWTTDK